MATLADTFALRLERYLPTLSTSLAAVYGDRAPELLERVRALMWGAMEARCEDLRLLDEARLLAPDWLQRPDMVGYVTYTERFASNLGGMVEHLDYLSDLGVTYP
jgi:amylosucrase